MFWQSMRFILVGIVNTFVGLSCIYGIMYAYDADPGVANLLGYAVGIIVSFTLNKIWTFNNNKPINEVLPKYVFVATTSYLMNLGVVVFATSYLAVNPYLGQLLGVAPYTICMFLGCRWFVFAPRRIV